MIGHCNKSIPHQRGVGLVEILVAVLVLAVGIMALAKFQGGLTRSGSDAKARTIATNIAQGQMETLRAFNNANQFLAIASGSMANPIERSGTSFNLSWTVNNFTFTGMGAALSSPPAGVNPTVKQIRVDVTWTDPSGSIENVSLESFINSSEPILAGSTLTNGIPAGRFEPMVTHKPGKAPESIAIPVLSGPTGTQTVEATSPIPDVEIKSGTRIISIDEITYNSSNIIQKRDSYKTVNCVCALRETPGDGLKPTYYDSQKGWIVGKQVSKTVGVMATGKGDIDFNRNTTIESNEKGLDFGSQPEICIICCRDHHDVTSTDSYDYYDPFRHTGDGNHLHYLALLDESTKVTSYIKASSNDDIYLEACRYIRVDGILRLAQDWRMENLQVIPASYFNTDTDAANYLSFVKKFIREYISSIATSGSNRYPTTTPAPVFTGWTEWAGLPNSETDDTNNTPSNNQTLAVGNTSELVGRGIYIDHMGPTLVSELQASLSSSPDDLSKVPFHEVNVTRLANWPTLGSAIRVSDEPIPAKGCTTSDCYSRGLVTAVSATTGVLAPAKITPSNSGLADSHPIDNATDSDAVEKQDALNFVVTGPTSTIGITINVNVIAATNAVPTSRVAGSDILVLDSNRYCYAVRRSDGIFKCELPTGVTALSFTVSGYTKPDTIPCESGTGQNKIKWNQPIIYDNRVVLQNTSTFSPTRTVANDQTADDITTFAFSGLPTDITTQTINLLIERDGGQLPSSCPASPPSP